MSTTSPNCDAATDLALAAAAASMISARFRNRACGEEMGAIEKPLKSDTLLMGI